MSDSTHYSEHFSRKEMRASETAARLEIDNIPAESTAANLERLCKDFLEPIRARFGPIRITSGYRCSLLNVAIGGSATSAHVDGRAADFEPFDASTSLKSVVEWIVASDLPFDQVIYEFGEWVHIGIARPGQVPRRQALMIFAGSGYLPYDPRDPRAKA